MKGLLCILPLILAVMSCESASTEQFIKTELDSVDTVVLDQNTSKELVDKEPWDHEKRKNNKENIQKRGDKTTESELKNKNAFSTKKPQSEVLVEIEKEPRKEPLVKREIVWGDTVVSLNYKKKVYPDPNVGCSASSEVFSIAIPIQEKSERMLIENGKLKKCKYTYSYTEGLYSENGSGAPSSGTIKFKNISNQKWKVDINIQFQVEVMGDIDKNKKIKAFDLSDVFE